MRTDSITAVSPVDGRYSKDAAKLIMFSEHGLINRRATVEVFYLIALSVKLRLVRFFSIRERRQLASLHQKFSIAQAKMIERIEKKGIKSRGFSKTNHDVNALVRWMTAELKNGSLADVAEMIHILLTSEDVNNVAYAMQICDALETVIIPALEELESTLHGLAQKWRKVVMCARTHGQPATPTTLGKEIKVFANRLSKQIKKLKNFKIEVKWNGASGNWSAHYAAYPEVDWMRFSKEFLEGFNQLRDPKYNIRFVPNMVTTQIESHDTYAELFHIIARINNILIGFCQDIWRYVSDDWLVQIAVVGEDGSSAMPQKINPIDAEKAEGNLEIANALCELFARKLSKSRLQRDLSDSTVIRNFGVAFAHSLIGYKSILRFLKRVDAGETAMTAYLTARPEVISEAFQVILRRSGHEGAYDAIKKATRGKKVTMADFHRLAEGLDLPANVKTALKAVNPFNYLGVAIRLAS